MPTRIFISQPMRDLTEEEIMQKRAIAEEKLCSLFKDPKIIDSYARNFTVPSGNRSVYLLGQSIACLSTADIAYFLKGWENARGCVIEHDVCKQYGITIMEET